MPYIDLSFAAAASGRVSCPVSSRCLSEDITALHGDQFRPSLCLPLCLSVCDTAARLSYYYEIIRYNSLLKHAVIEVP